MDEVMVKVGTKKEGLTPSHQEFMVAFEVLAEIRKEKDSGDENMVDAFSPLFFLLDPCTDTVGWISKAIQDFDRIPLLASFRNILDRNINKCFGVKAYRKILQKKRQKGLPPIVSRSEFVDEYLGLDRLRRKYPMWKAYDYRRSDGSVVRTYMPTYDYF